MTENNLVIMLQMTFSSVPKGQTDNKMQQILLLYKTWVYYNNWYVKIPQCGYMEHGFEYNTFYVQKHTVPLAIFPNILLVLTSQ